MRRGKRPPPVVVSDDVEAAARRIAWLMELRNIILTRSIDRRRARSGRGRARCLDLSLDGVDLSGNANEKTASPVLTGTQRFFKMSDDDMEDCESQGEVHR